MSAELPSLFRQRAGEVLSLHSELSHRWKEDSSTRGATLLFPKQQPGGFDVLVSAHEEQLTVSTEGAHVHFDRADQEPEQIVEDALGLVRDLLSPDMRVRELHAGRTPYRWFIEAFDGETWRVEHVTGLLFWNYFGHRSEQIYQNDVLPGRLAI